MSKNNEFSKVLCEHQGVRCISINRATKTFCLKDGKERVNYTLPHYVAERADQTEYIRKVIEVYLLEKEQCEVDARGPEQEKEDAKALLRMLPFADKDTLIRRHLDGELWAGIPGCWGTVLREGLFASLNPGEEKSIRRILEE